MIRAAIFDYGETLVRHRVPFELVLPRAIRATYNFFAGSGLKSTFEQYAAVDKAVFELFADAEARERVDIPDAVKYRELVRRLFPTRPKHWRDQAAGTARRVFYGATAGNHVAQRGAKSCLRDLRSLGVKMAVLSNFGDQEALERSLRQFGLYDYFTHIYASSKLGARKPDPKAFAKCLASLKVRADQAVFVGDSPDDDIAGAQACGMTAILVDTEPAREGGAGRHSPDFRVTTLSNVPGIIKRLNSAGSPAKSKSR